MEYSRVEELSTRLKLDPVILEKVLRITEVLGAMASREDLSSLVFKGGSALNYVYLKDGMRRLSIDLDFNAIGWKEEVFDYRDSTVKPALTVLGRTMDYEVKGSHSYDRSSYRFYYTNSMGVKDYIKIEISYIDRIPVLQPLLLEFSFPFSEEEVKVQVLALEDLLAEKLRALYTRSRGQDLFDAYYASKLEFRKELVRKALIYKLTRAKVAYKPRLYFKKISNFSAGKYETDLRGFVLPGFTVPFDDALRRFLDHYDFLKDLDGRDKLFIELFRDLFGETISKRSKAEIKATPELYEAPLHYLFGEDTKLTELCGKATLDDIRIFQR